MPARSLALLATALLAFSWTGRALARDRISVVHADDFPTIDVVVELSQGLGQITTEPGAQDVALLENGRPGPTVVVRKRFGDLDDGVAVVVLVDGELNLITRDHSVLEELDSLGVPAEEARRRPDWSHLARAFGP